MSTYKQVINQRTSQWNLVNVDSMGPTGPQGPTGPAGANGATGATGSVEAIPVTNILYVDGNRADDYIPDGSLAKPFKKIQDSIDAVVSPSATNKYLIDIAPGAYYSDALAINKGFITFRGTGFNSSRITGAITVTNPVDPTPVQITFLDIRVSGGLTCLASHIAINVNDCWITGSDWIFTPTVVTDYEWLQVWSGLWYANVTLTGAYAYLFGGGIYSIWTVTDKEFNINNADINEPFEALLSGTVVGSAFGNRASNSKFTLNTGANLHIDADTEGGSVITMAGGTLTRSTKGGNLLNDSSVTGTTVKDALETLNGNVNGIILGTTDAFSRRQIWNKLTDAILRLGSLASDGDATNVVSQGSVMYGKNLQGDDMASSDFAYVRLKPNRIGLYNSKLGGYIGYIMKMDGTEDTWYVTDNAGNQIFKLQRSTGNLNIAGELSIKVYSQITEPALTANNNMAIWIDISDANRVYFIFRRGSGDNVSVELTGL